MVGDLVINESKQMKLYWNPLFLSTNLEHTFINHPVQIHMSVNIYGKFIIC